MPWKASHVMDLRTEFSVRALRNTTSFIGLCREYGISVKTGYKWRRRFLAEGFSGLADRSRRPHTRPHQVSEDVVCHLVHLKLAHRHLGSQKDP